MLGQIDHAAGGSLAQCAFPAPSSLSPRLSYAAAALQRECVEYLAANFTELCEAGSMGLLAAEHHALLSAALSDLLRSRLQVHSTATSIPENHYLSLSTVRLED